MWISWCACCKVLLTAVGGQSMPARTCCCCQLPLHLPLLRSCRRFISGETLVVDGAAWLHRPQLVPRQMVSKVSRSVEGKSRKIGTAADAVRSKL